MGGGKPKVEEETETEKQDSPPAQDAVDVTVTTVSTVMERTAFRRAEIAHQENPEMIPEFWGNRRLRMVCHARFPKLLHPHGSDVAIQTVTPIKELLR